MAASEGHNILDLQNMSSSITEKDIPTSLDLGAGYMLPVGFVWK